MKTTKTLLGILAITTALAFQLDAQSFLTNGLVAYYPFNGNANDASGNGNNGIPVGASPTTDQFGKTNAAYAFTGGAQYISFANSPSLNTGNQLTLAAWVNFSQGGSYNPRIICKNGDNGYELLTLGTGSSRQIAFYAGAAPAVTSSQYVPAGQWVYLVATYANNQMSIYINGSLDGTTTASCVFTNSTNLSIGHNTINGLDQYVGKIDNVRIYNRALTPTEVSQLYTVESGLQIGLVKAVKPVFAYLTISNNYQLQISSDLNTWTNAGPAFMATNSFMDYPQYWDVDNWNQLFFRVIPAQ